jgi:stage III sporulation protein SpoIIIAA
MSVTEEVMVVEEVGREDDVAVIKNEIPSRHLTSAHVEEFFDQEVVPKEAESHNVKRIQANTDVHEVRE